MSSSAIETPVTVAVVKFVVLPFIPTAVTIHPAATFVQFGEGEFSVLNITAVQGPVPVDDQIVPEADIVILLTVILIAKNGFFKNTKL
jgi:hypothetical protein